MNPILPFLLALALLVGIAKACGYLSTRWGQPAVLGALLAGLILGPSALDMLHWPIFASAALPEVIRYLAELGVLFLMFIAGLEVDLDSMRHTGRPAVSAGTLGVLVPIGLSLILLLFSFQLEHAIFVGLILGATSVSISAQTLMEMGLLRSRVGLTLLGAAVVDDVWVILAVSIFTAVTGSGTGGALGIVWLVVKMIAFVAVGGWLGMRYLGRIGLWMERQPISEGVAALAVVTLLVYAWSAEALGGMASITGAFLAGLLLARTPLHGRIATSMHTLAYAWLTPVFFISIGLEANAQRLGWSGAPVALIIIVLAIVSKLAGAGLGSFIAGFSPGDALRLAVGMVSRGEVGLIVATVGLNSGMIHEDLFAAIVLTVIVTTVLTPIALRALYPAGEHPASG